MNVYNATQNRFIVEDLKVAKTMLERLCGLLGTHELCEGCGLLIPHCQGVHTFGMVYPIDALYLNEDNQVIAALKDLTPNLMGPVKWKAKAVLELPSGTIEKTHTHEGDFLLIDDTGDGALSEPIPVKRSVLNRFSNMFLF